MDSLRKASEHLLYLEQRIKELEQELKAKDELVRRLSQEIPSNSLKNARLGLSSTDMITGGETLKTPEKWTGPSVREAFIKYFTQRAGHVFWPSSPCIPVNDPTLLFANSGMNQFKSIFLGQIDPSDPKAKLTRAANTQKCIRAGGKHNDLDDVGKDLYHHTFFEMLGNWSFGDYFKKEAIDWAWDLLVNVYGLDPNRLYTSYFGGDPENNVPRDDEARNLWLKYLPANHVLPFGTKENWWSAGDTGPCGPCSEIHYDRIGGRDASSLVNRDDPNVVEIWNLVFMQYNRRDDGKIEKLPAAHVDTGMGFERLVSCLQNKLSNYDTDVFEALLTAIHKLCPAHIHPYEGKTYAADEADGFIDKAYRILADHIRTLTFAITDGCVPSNEGRGYVLRRILRRAVRFANDVLQIPRGGFASLVTVVVDVMGPFFPELKAKATFVKEVLQDEEDTFFTTLKKGRVYFSKIATDLESKGEKIIPGKDAFHLHTTLGFPVDLTQIMAEEKGLTVDMKGYQVAFKQFKEISGQGSKFKSSQGTLRFEAKETDALEKLGVTPTIEDSRYEWFKNVNSTVAAIFDPKAEGFVDSLEVSGKEEEEPRIVGIVLKSSNFYFESGGQQWDCGTLTTQSNNSEDEGEIVLNVVNCQSYKGYVVHSGPLAKSVKVGDAVTCRVDYERRKRLAANHTATHLLNLGLKTVIGGDIDQKGSLVADDKFRFDFNSNAGLTEEQIAAIETLVRDRIEKALPVNSRIVPLGDARKIKALRAVFGETYPDPVRLVIVGAEIDEVLEDPTSEKWESVSVELCGGTHLKNTADARDFALVEESSIAKGIRRVVALTGEAAAVAELQGENLAARLESLVLETDIFKAEEDYRALRAEFELGGLSAARKGKLANGLNALQKRLQAAKKGELERIQLLLTEEMAKNVDPAEDAQAFVYVFQAANGNLQKASAVLREKYPNKSFCLFMKDSEKNKCALLLSISAQHESSGAFVGKQILAQLSEASGAKGGGPVGGIAGSCELGNMDSAINAAKKAFGLI